MDDGKLEGLDFNSSRIDWSYKYVFFFFFIEKMGELEKIIMAVYMFVF